MFMLSHIVCAAAMSAALFSGAVSAQEDAPAAGAETGAQSVDLGPAVGETAPVDWSSTDQTETVRTFESLTGHAGLVLVFNRSFDWCPYCQQQALEIEDRYGEFAARGYGVASLTHDDWETNARFAGRHELRMVLLSDPDHAIIDAFDVRDPAFEGRRGRFEGLPYPIAFVMAPDGEVLDKFWHEPGFGEQRGYRERVSVDDMLSALDQLRSAE